MATRTWTGGALPVAQVETITIANTWAANDTATVTINGRDITLTVGTTATTTQIATELAAALSSTSTSLGTGYSVTERGPNVAEFREFTYAASSSTVVCTGVTKGKPVTVTTSENTAGDGTCTRATTTTATGKWHFDNADNWSGATVPVDGDTVVWDSGDVPVKYGLSQTGVTPAAVIITKGYTGYIGLPKVNVDDPAYPYPEYRTQYLTWCDSADATNTTFLIGTGDGTGPGRVNIDFNTGQVTVTVIDHGSRLTTGIPVCLFKGGATTSVYEIRKGDVGIAFYSGETANIDVLRVTYLTSQSSDSRVVCKSGVTFNSVNIYQSGGTLDIESATSSGTIDMTAGELIIRGATAHPDIEVQGGTLYYLSTGTITSLKVGSAGVFDRRGTNLACTITTPILYPGAKYYDPQRLITETNGIDIVGGGYSSVVIDKGYNINVVFAAA